MSEKVFQAEAVANHIVQWLESYALRAGMKGFVVGVSGGIDSAVTASLCARTGLETTVVEMPIYQAESQVSRARQHMDALAAAHPNVRHAKVELTPVFDALVAELPEAEELELKHLTLANTRARLRMTTLYHIAGLQRALVAGTGNKVEDFGVGFFTKYGDGGVDLSPIADLVKTEVYALGKFLGVNEHILTAPPTDGLWGDDRTDEDQIGATYPELEWAMKVGDALPVDATARQQEVFAIYQRLNKANRHKMEPIPVCTIPEHVKFT